MSDTTALDDLPQQQSNNDPNIVNEIVSGIQEASKNGGLELPSRDVPMVPATVNNDIQTTPNFVPTSQDDYIKTHETSQDVLNTAKQEQQRIDNFNYIYDELHIYILVAFLYFIFMLPVFNKSMMKYAPFCFSDDKNLNLQGTLFKSLLYAGLLYVLIKSINIISNI